MAFKQLCMANVFAAQEPLSWIGVRRVPYALHTYDSLMRAP